MEYADAAKALGDNHRGMILTLCNTILVAEGKQIKQPF